MAKECLDSCPKIAQLLADATYGSFMPPVLFCELASVPDAHVLQELEAAREDARMCPGPVVDGVRNVKRGIFGREVTETVYECVLEIEPIPNAMPTESSL